MTNRLSASDSFVHDTASDVVILHLLLLLHNNSRRILSCGFDLQIVLIFIFFENSGVACGNGCD